MGHPEIAVTLIQAGANVNFKNDKGDSAATLAVKDQQLAVLKELAKAKTDFTTIDKDGNSLVYLAVQNGNMDYLPVLKEGGADLNVGNKYWTPLTYSVTQGNVEYVKSLVAAGADVNKAQDKIEKGTVTFYEEKGTVTFFLATLLSCLNVRKKVSVPFSTSALKYSVPIQP